jgi:hypothetical protein
MVIHTASRRAAIWASARRNPHRLRHPVPDLPQPFLEIIHDHLRKLRRAALARDDGGDVVHLLQTGYGH